METKDILVFIEQRDNVIQSVSYELLSEARKLVKQIKHVKFEVVGILLGSNLGQLPHDVLNHGADRVYVADHPELAHYSTLRYTHVISELVKQHKPDAFLIGASVIGRDLARVLRHVWIQALPRMRQRLRSTLMKRTLLSCGSHDLLLGAISLEPSYVRIIVRKWQRYVLKSWMRISFKRIVLALSSTFPINRWKIVFAS